ncbi:MAG: hypothetical protein KY466_04310 [Gemmatimonadetes bacterium]|nr:hypothetical protein [Gemmatimonadota bacterium]
MRETPVVLKFGGAALATPARVRHAARRIARWRDAGWPVVAVASACGRSTEAILRRVEGVAGSWELAGRELDRALATGELLASSLLSAALLGRGVPAYGLAGGEAGIVATGAHGRAEVIEVVPHRLRSLLDRGVVPVVAGFQAARPDGETVTLGRGTSDVSAAHLAAALGSSSFHLVKDVRGVHEQDPHRHPTARLLPRLGYDDMERLAHDGARVVHPDAVRLARRHGLLLRIYHYRSPTEGDHGTTIGPPSGNGRRGEHGLARAGARPRDATGAGRNLNGGEECLSMV